MKIKLTALLILSSTWAIAQKEIKHYLGKHYGDHPNWEYFNELKTYRNGDTLVYEETRHDRNKIRTASSRSHRHAIKLVLKGNNPVLVYDSAIYGFGYQFSLKAKGDSLVDNAGQLYPKGNLPLFTSLEALQLYLKYVPPTRNFQLEFNYPDDAPEYFRPFTVKTIGEVTITVSKGYVFDCYELAVFSRDSSNAGDGKLYIDKATHETIKKECVGNEFSAPGRGYKSIVNELMVSETYRIDLKSISAPSPNDYIEAAFTIINRDKNFKEGSKIIERALSQNVTVDLVQAQINIMKEISTEDEILKFIRKHIDNPNLRMRDINMLGRYFLNGGKMNIAKEFLLFNANKHPDDFVSLESLARFYSTTGELPKAKEFLEKAVKLDMDETNRNNIMKNIDRLSKGEKML